jgi:hypothetical protein
MANFTVTVPDADVNDLTEAVALYEAVAVPTTAAGKIALAQTFTLNRLEEVLVNFRAQRAADVERKKPKWPRP